MLTSLLGRRARAAVASRGAGSAAASGLAGGLFALLPAPQFVRVLSKFRSRMARGGVLVRGRRRRLVTLGRIVGHIRSKRSAGVGRTLARCALDVHVQNGRRNGQACLVEHSVEARRCGQQMCMSKTTAGMDMYAWSSIRIRSELVGVASGCACPKRPPE